jgi:hypothetical protein
MSDGIPRLEAIDASPLADLATKYLTQGLKAPRTDLATSEATISTACATLAMLGEIHRLRVAVEALASKQEGDE